MVASIEIRSDVDIEAKNGSMWPIHATIWHTMANHFSCDLLHDLPGTVLDLLPETCHNRHNMTDSKSAPGKAQLDTSNKNVTIPLDDWIEAALVRLRRVTGVRSTRECVRLAINFAAANYRDFRDHGDPEERSADDIFRRSHHRIIEAVEQSVTSASAATSVKIRIRAPLNTSVFCENGDTKIVFEVNMHSKDDVEKIQRIVVACLDQATTVSR